MLWASGEVFTTGSYIVPVTMMESYYKLIAQGMCGVTYAYLLGALCNIFRIKARDSNRYYEDMDELNNVLAIKRINNPNLSTSLRQYFRCAPTAAVHPQKLLHFRQSQAQRISDEMSLNVYAANY